MKFRLGDWTVDEHANLLLRDGQNVRIEKRAMALLIELATARGGVVSKDALIDAVWNGAVISDHSVANVVSDLRRVLGDDRRAPRYIETIPKRGYRLIADIEELSEPAHPSAGGRLRAPQRRWVRLAPMAGLVAAIAVGLAVWLWPRSGEPRLLLTNIENLSGDPEMEIVAHSLAEMLTVALAGEKYELVRWRAHDLTEQQPGGGRQNDLRLNRNDKQLSARIILESGAPTISLQLTGALDNSLMWANAYPLRTNRFALLAESVVADLSEPLGLTEPLRAFAGVDADAIEAYWRARYLWSLREHGALREARRILADLTRRVPDYAPAHAALADIYAHKTAEEMGVERQETFTIAERHLARATALDPGLGEARITRAYLDFFRDENADAAMDEIERAVIAQPGNAVAWQTRAMIASATGDNAASLKSIERARTLDPLSPSMLWDEVWFLYIAGQYDEALKASQSARRVSAPVHVYEALIHMAANDEAAAFSSWMARALERGLSEGSATEINQFADANGHRAALAMLAQEARPSADFAEHEIPLAVLQTWLGETDDAVATLLGSPQREKSWWWSWYRVMPGLDAVRGDERLSPLADQTGQSSTM